MEEKLVTQSFRAIPQTVGSNAARSNIVKRERCGATGKARNVGAGKVVRKGMTVLGKQIGIAELFTQIIIGFIALSQFQYSASTSVLHI